MNQLFAKLSDAFHPHSSEETPYVIDEKLNLTAAVTNTDEPKALHAGRRRIKECHTSHWDLDYLSREEAEKIMAGDDDC
jgi:hypothetical protein